MEILGDVPEDVKTEFKQVASDVGMAAAHGLNGVPTEIIIGAMAYTLIRIAVEMSVDPEQLKSMLTSNIDMLYSKQPKPTIQ